MISLTGPRQSGKTTLARAAFPDREYPPLEVKAPHRLGALFSVGVEHLEGDLFPALGADPRVEAVPQGAPKGDGMVGKGSRMGARSVAAAWCRCYPRAP